MPLVIVLVCVGALLAAAVAGAAVARRPAAPTAVYGATLALCLIAGVAAGGHLLFGADALTLKLPFGLPWLGVNLRLDPLSAFFLVLLDVGGAAAALYALGHAGGDAPRVLPFFPAFLGAMHAVLLADDAFTFLVAWESMSLASWALVMARHRARENASAGYVYLIMAAFGTLALLLGFGLLAGAGGAYGFAAMRATDHGAVTAVLVFVLVVLGAGSKAGLVPLHAWLPLAHPAAPSHVSALMSGVMTKVAVYAFVRIVFDLLGEPSWWMSTAILVLGGLTALLGVLYALMQHDLKRLLAYHTVENIGIIFIGLGLALAFQSHGMHVLAALALTAALFHCLNHMLFKNLLFLGAGAVLAATGERDMERLGGLIHRMPWTSAAFLTGCVAISALPPLNGFVSEWLTFQAIIAGAAIPHWGLKVLVPATGALLALAAALAAACFVKAFGIVFLGRARSVAAEAAEEAGGPPLAAMAALAGLCLVAGVLPGPVIDALAPVASMLLDARLPEQTAAGGFAIAPIEAARSSYSGLLVFAFITIAATAMWFAVHRFGTGATRRAPPWDCGAPDAGDSAAQYTATSFAQPIRRVFGSVVFRARERLDMPAPGDLRAARLHVILHDLVWEWLYVPVAGAVAFVSARLDRLQHLTIRRYLGMVFVTLIALLLAIALWA